MGSRCLLRKCVTMAFVHKHVLFVVILFFLFYKASLLFSNERKNQAKVPIVYAQLNSSNPCFIICFSISKEIFSELLFIHVALNKKSFWNTKCVWCNRLLHGFNLIICSRKIFECALTLYYLINDSISPLNFACYNF